MRVLLTGGSGFLGSHIAEELDRRGIDTRVLVRSTSDVRFLETLDCVTLVRGKLSDPQSLRDACRGVDAIVHAAGLTKARTPAEFHYTNAQGTDALIRAASVTSPNLDRMVLVSSLSAIGPSSDGRPVSADAPPHPVTHYGRSKLAAELIAKAAAGTIPITILRPPMIYGPRDREILPFFQAVKMGVLPLTSSPTTVLSAIFAADCAAACISALNADVPSGSSFFVDDGKAESLARRIADIEVALGKRARVRVPIPRPVLWGAALATEAFGRVAGRAVMLTRDKLNELLAPHWVCDSTDTRGVLRWEPQIDFSEGSKITAAWYREARWL